MIQKAVAIMASPRAGRKHNGIDLLCEPGQPIMSPVDGKISRIARPYADDTHFSGVVIDAHRISIKMFYIEVDKSRIGQSVKAGDIIGRAQDISKKYGGGMLPHIHLQIDRCDPLLFLST